jgi:hypothetical protein
MIDSRQIESTMDELRPGWRERRDKRKSPWNLACLGLGWSAAYIYMKYLCAAAVWLNIRIHPQHSALAGRFFDYLVKTSSRWALLTGMPLIIPAIVCGFLTGNVIAWLIPPARRAMDREAAGDREMTFAGSNAGLLKFGGIASAVGFILSAIGILMFRT